MITIVMVIIIIIITMMIRMIMIMIVMIIIAGLDLSKILGATKILRKGVAITDIGVSQLFEGDAPRLPMSKIYSYEYNRNSLSILQ